jgi:hypothetical protein
MTVERENNTVRVRVRGANGKVFVVNFGRVRAVRVNRPEGMVLYALSELSAQPALRRFAFANWDDESSARLEVDAETITVCE